VVRAHAIGNGFNPTTTTVREPYSGAEVTEWKLAGQAFPDLIVDGLPTDPAGPLAGSVLAAGRLTSVWAGASGTRRGGRYDAAVAGDRKVPSEGDETRFWALIESAWAPLGPEPAQARRALAGRDLDSGDVDPYALDPWLAAFLDNLTGLCTGLSATELTDLDRVLERKLYEIDREDIQAVTDGSDDGFLYCRGFIVAAGRDFYHAVSADPRMAVLDAECEGMCYFFARLHIDRFGGYPDTGSGISRESASNLAGWPG
jgi:hypothetical protein